jgi:O-antigen/teichoic acid export membrane protein
MQRTFLANILFLLAINLLVKPVYIFGIDRGVQNAVGPEVYGLYFSLFNFAFILQFFADLGINNFNVRHIAQNTHLTRKYFSRLLSIKLALSLVYLAVVALLAIAVSYRHVLELLVLITINQVLLTILMFIRSHVSGLGWYRWDSILSVLDRLMMILICGTLLWGGIVPLESFRIEWFVIAQTVSFGGAILFGLFLLQREIIPVRLSWKWPFSLAILKQSLPFALAFLLMTAYTRIDAVMLERLLSDGPYQAGLYAGAYRILDAFNVVGFLFASLLFPMYSKLLKSEQGTQDLATLAFRILFSIGVCIAVPVALYAHEIMDLLYVESEGQWGHTMEVLILTLIPLYTIAIYGTLLTANNNLAQMNVIFACGVVLNIVLNLLLIYRYGALGAAIATVITQTAILIPHLYFSHKWIGVKIPGRILVRAALLLGISLFAVLEIRTSLGWPWWLSFILSCGAVFVVSMIVRMFEPRSVVKLVRGNTDKV